MKKIILIILFIILLIICVEEVYIWKLNNLENKEDKIFKRNVGTIQGKVILRTGNCMPTICNSHSSCSSNCSKTGVMREINIRGISIHYPSDEYGAIIKTIKSDKNGDFITTLPVGNYSIFVVENNKDYCGEFNYLNGSMVNCPISIIENQTTTFDLVINYASD